jgi:MinD-like ATPase involved in chromosome partitioning or flagellar assembly
VHIYPKSKAARAYKEIAAKMLDVEYDSKKDREKIIKMLLKKLGLKA